MSDIKNKLTNYLNAVKAKTGHPGWLEYPIKTPLSKNTTITEWNAIVEDIRELASDDEATVAFIEYLTQFVNEIHSRVGALSTQISSKSQAHLYGTFTDFISDLISGIDIGINQGDTVFTIQKGSPDFIVVDTNVHSDYLPNTVPIPDIDSVPTSPPDAGVIYYVANKYYIMAIESGVSAPDLGIDSELDLYSPRAVMNSVITAAIQNLYTYFSGYTAKVDENIGRINDLDSKVATVESISKGANQAVSFYDYLAMISELNNATYDKYKVGQNIMIEVLDVPDLWISYVVEDFESYNYGNDEFLEDLKNNSHVKVGHYYLSALETQKVDLTGYFKKSSDTVYTNGVVPVQKPDGSLIYKGIGDPGYESDGNIPVYRGNNLNTAMPNTIIRTGIPKYPAHAANKQYVDDLVGDIATALTELHNYAMNLKGGEA